MTSEATLLPNRQRHPAEFPADTVVKHKYFISAAIQPSHFSDYEIINPTQRISMKDLMNRICQQRRRELTRHMVLIRLALIVVFLSARMGAFAQRLSLGFIGGTNGTHDFHTSRFQYVDESFPGGLATSLLFSDSHSLIAGPAIEVDLAKGLAVELDALHRTLQLDSGFIPPGGQQINTGEVARIGTWEFPVFVKYKIPLSKVRPFVEIGPSFRVRKNPNATDPSAYGIAAGFGIGFRVGRLRVEPAIRYTHWSGEPPFPKVATDTNPNQIELLTGISYATSPESWHIFGGKFHIGPVAGAVFLRALAPELRAGTPVSESQGYTAGIMTDVDFTQRFSLEVDGLYRPIRAQLVNELSPFSVVTWQFPVLAKFRWPFASQVRPFVEAGPSFRLSGNFNGYYPTHLGFTAGLGLETHWHAIRVAPAVRYTRWTADSNQIEFRTLPNQIEILAGFSF